MSDEVTRTAASPPARAGESPRQLIRKAKQATRRRFPAEEKIRILLEGIRAEVSVSKGVGESYLSSSMTRAAGILCPA